jgi:hypothetical protein
MSLSLEPYMDGRHEFNSVLPGMHWIDRVGTSPMQPLAQYLNTLANGQRK